MYSLHCGVAANHYSVGIYQTDAVSVSNCYVIVFLFACHDVDRSPSWANSETARWIQQQGQPGLHRGVHGCCIPLSSGLHLLHPERVYNIFVRTCS